MRQVIREDDKVRSVVIAAQALNRAQNFGPRFNVSKDDTGDILVYVLSIHYKVSYPVV
jgi:hypothetical protein